MSDPTRDGAHVQAVYVALAGKNPMPHSQFSGDLNAIQRLTRDAKRWEDIKHRLDLLDPHGTGVSNIVDLVESKFP